MQEVVAEDYSNDLPIELMNRKIELSQRLHEAYVNCTVPSMKLEDFGFPDGDFDWSPSEAGDWHVYCCGEKDCDQQWHKEAYLLSAKRVGGILTLEEVSVDEDGNWDTDCYWTDDPAEDLEPFENSEVAMAEARCLFEYFHGWAEYWIDAASSMSDPCDETHTGPHGMTPESWVRFCFTCAEEHIRSMESIYPIPPVGVE